MLDLVPQLGWNVVDVGGAHPRGLAQGNADHLVVWALFVLHVKDADRTHADPTAWERRLTDEDECVEWVAILGEGVLDEAVVGGIAHRREEPAIKHDRAE